MTCLLLRSGGLCLAQRPGAARRAACAALRAVVPPRGRSRRATATFACVVSTALVISERKRYTRQVGGEDASLLQLGERAPEDYYALLRVAPDSPAADIKAAYRKLAKLVHPDLVGPAAHNLAIVMNLAVATLTEDATRAAYDAALLEWRANAAPSFDGIPVSLWAGSDTETEAIFVDECACIGCGKCVHVAPQTFALEDQWGRARVHTQWGDDRETIAEAIATCPVSTISYVQKTELAVRSRYGCRGTLALARLALRARCVLTSAVSILQPASCSSG